MPFDAVWFCLFGACVRVPVCLYVGMCICMPCTWDRFFFYFLNSEELSMTEEQQKVTIGKQTVWQQRSLLILQLGIFKCNHTKRKWKERERRRKKTKTKERQNWSCQFVPELSQTIPFCSLVGVSVSWQPICHCHSISFPGLLYTRSQGRGLQWRHSKIKGHMTNTLKNH